MLQLKYLSCATALKLSLYVPLGLSGTIGTVQTFKTFFPLPLTFAFTNTVSRNKNLSV